MKKKKPKIRPVRKNPNRVVRNTDTKIGAYVMEHDGVGVLAKVTKGREGHVVEVTTVGTADGDVVQKTVTADHVLPKNLNLHAFVRGIVDAQHKPKHEEGKLKSLPSSYLNHQRVSDATKPVESKTVEPHA